MTANYAHKLITAAQRCNVVVTRVVLQDMLLAHAAGMGGMLTQLARVNENGICAALTVKFAEAAIMGRLSTFGQNSLAQELPSALRTQFATAFMALHDGSPGNFIVAADHLDPQSFPVMAPDRDFAFMVAMRDAIERARVSVGNTVAINMAGDGGHVIGLKAVPGGTSSFFDANAGMYQFHDIDDLRAFWRAAYDTAEYGFTHFQVCRFRRAPTP